MLHGLAAVAAASGAASAKSTSSSRARIAGPAAAAAPAVNPLDPLTADEIQTTFTVIEQSKNLAPGTFFPTIKLNEPPKADVLAWSPGQPFQRRAFANVFDRGANKLYEAIVDLRTRQLVSWTERVGAQPAVYLTEWTDAAKIVSTYAPWKAAMRDRGIDPKDVYVDVWAPGDLPVPGVPAGTRLLRAIAFYGGTLPNPYDRPIERPYITVDMNKLRVVDFQDTGIKPVDTTRSGNATSGRTGLKPLVVQQPNGPSFQIMNGREVAWQNWRFRVDYSPREGLVLHRIGYAQGNTV